MLNTYEEVRQRHLVELVGRLPEHIERLTWSPERLREERTNRLRALLKAAVQRAPWHRERLAGIDPDAVQEDDLPQLPAMTKDDLMAHWDAIVTVGGVTLDRVEAHLQSLTSDAYFDGTLHACASGGSSGRRGVFLWDWESWMLSYIGFVRHMLRAQVSGEIAASGPLVAAVVAADRPAHQTSSMAQTFANPLASTHRFPVTLPLSEIVAGLNAVQPVVLTGYSSALFLLAHEARAGRLRIAPLSVTAMSEPLLPEMRQAFEEVWGCRVGNWWGTSEGGPAGVSCFRAPGMHLPDDLLIVEPVDAAGAPVTPGERSAKVYLTNLMNRAQPLLRYEITDEVTLLEEPCPCGCTHRRVADIEGRQDDGFVYAGGVHVHPIAFRSPLGRERHIVEYQVIQTRDGADVRIRRTGPVDIAQLRARIEAELARLGVAQPQVAVAEVDVFERQASGKLKRFFRLPASA